MPQWAGSCWYFLRFLDPRNSEAAFSEEAANAWLPIDLYVGGAEHAVLHLLYSRFWHKALYDAGVIPEAFPEPFQKLVHQGMILGEVEYTGYALTPELGGEKVSAADVKKNEEGELRRKSDDAAVGEVTYAFDLLQKLGDGGFALADDASIKVQARAHKMSKSRGNVVNPDDIVRDFGADSLRLYEMFMGPLEATKPWSTSSIGGVRRFLDRYWAAALRAEDVAAGTELERTLHQTIKKVTEDIDALRFNTAISQMMVLVNELTRAKQVPSGVVKTLTLLVHPFAPHIAEEVWARLGGEESVQHEAWPKHDPARLEVSEVVVPVQINGKVRGRITLGKGASEDDAMAAAKADEGVAKQLEGKTIRKIIWVPNKILNVIVG